VTAGPPDRDRRLRRLADWAWQGRPTRWSELLPRLRPTVSEVVRLSAAAVVAWLLARLVTGTSSDLTSPLTALLVVQATAYSSLRMGLLRVAAVLTGVLVAVAFSTLFGLSWWSLGAVIAASLVLAKVFRLGEQALEVPISAMLILAVGSPDLAAESRVLHTLVGAGVGMLFNVVLPAAVPSQRAGTAVLRVAYAMAEVLDNASRSMAGGQPRRADVERWADETRQVAARVAEASSAVVQVKEGRRLNPRALASADVEPALRSGLDQLEGSRLAIRALFSVILAELPEDSDEGLASGAFDEDARLAFSVVLADIADCLRAFGQLVRAEAEGREEEAERALAESLEILRETRAILTELLISRPSDDVGLWLLRGSVLAAVEEVLRQLDLERRARLRRSWRREPRLATLVPMVREALPARLGPGRAGRRGLARRGVARDT
jgi:hypothetical protein